MWNNQKQQKLFSIMSNLQTYYQVYNDLRLTLDLFILTKNTLAECRAAFNRFKYFPHAIGSLDAISHGMIPKVSVWINGKHLFWMWPGMKLRTHATCHVLRKYGRELSGSLNTSRDLQKKQPSWMVRFVNQQLDETTMKDCELVLILNDSKNRYFVDI